MAPGSVVQVFNDQGQLLYYFGQKGAGPWEFQLPSGLQIDSSDRIYVVDSYNRRVQIFHYTAVRQAVRGSSAMKSVAAIFMLALLIAPAAYAQQPQADTLGMHNLTPGSGASVYLSSGPGGCAFCHPPHSGIGGISGLWNQKFSSAVYDPYNSTTYHQTGNTQPPLGVTSSLCLSCHDGTVAMGTNQAYGQAGTSGSWAPGDTFGRT